MATRASKFTASAHGSVTTDISGSAREDETGGAGESILTEVKGASRSSSRLVLDTVAHLNLLEGHYGAWKVAQLTYLERLRKLDQERGSGKLGDADSFSARLLNTYRH